MPDDLRTAGSCSLVRRQQYGRFKFEMARRVRRDIAGEANVGDPFPIPQQQSAALRPIPFSRIGQDEVKEGS